MADIHDHVQIEQALAQLGLVPDDGDVPPIIIGEVNDGINVGDGLGEIYGGKVGVSLKFRTLKAGAGVIIATDEEEEVVTIAATGTGAGDVEGTPPTRVNALAIYFDTTGLKIKDSNLRQFTNSAVVALEGEDPAVPASWYPLIGLTQVAPNGSPGGLTTMVGNAGATTVLNGSGPNRYVSTSGHKIISELTNVPWSVPARGTVTHSGGDTQYAFQLNNSGANPGGFRFFVGNRNPEGNVIAYQGDMYIRSSGDSGSTVYFKATGTATNTGWIDIIGATPANLISIEKIDSPTPDYDDVQDTINQFGLAGTSGSGYIVDAGGGAVSVSVGSGFIRVSDAHTAVLKAFNWVAHAPTAIPSGEARFIGVEYNGGAPQVAFRTTDDWDYKNEFRLGSVVNEGGTLHILNNPQRASDAVGSTFERFYETAPLVRANRLGGIIPSEIGTRNLLVSSGELYDGFNEFDIPVIDTSGSDTFDAYYRDGVGGWTKQGAQTQWNNLQYDDGDGTLATFTNNRFGVHWLYIEADGNLILLYGQGEWTTQAGAEGSTPPATTPLRISTHGRLLGRIVFLEGQASAISIDNVWSDIFAASGGGVGDVVGPASVTDDSNLAIYSGTTGKVIKDSQFRQVQSTYRHRLQFKDPNGDAWADVLQLEWIPPNGGGTWCVLGNKTAHSTVIRSISGNVFFSSNDPLTMPTKRFLHEAMVTEWALPKAGSIENDGSDNNRVLELKTTGANPGASKIHVGNRTPEANVTANQGALYIKKDGDNSALYAKESGVGSAGWSNLINPNVGFYAYRALGTQTIPSLTETKVEFPDDQDDPGDDFNTTTDVFVAPTKGTYSFSASARLDADKDCEVYLRLYHNTTLVAEAGVAPGQIVSIGPCVSIARRQMNAADTMEVRIYQTDDTSATLQNTALHFAGVQLRKDL